MSKEKSPYLPIVLVSGLPRSGTSMMMRMLQAGGMTLLTDDTRPADASNPWGYFEYAPVKASKQAVDWVASAPGKAVKVVSPLLQYLPLSYSYKVIFMERAMASVMQSQHQMLEREGKIVNPKAEYVLEQYYTRHLEQVHQWLKERPNILVLPLSFKETLQCPLVTARVVSDFLDTPLNVEAMVAIVSPALSQEKI